MIDQEPLPFEQHVHAPVAEPPTLLRNGLHPLAQNGVVLARRPIPHRHAA